MLLCPSYTGVKYFLKGKETEGRELIGSEGLAGDIHLRGGMTPFVTPGLPMLYCGAHTF